MGYTTKFKGEFEITPYPSKELIEDINCFSSKRHDEKGYPGIWCQWIINSNGKLAWNGAEKFYYYVEWLQYLIREYFEAQGYKLNGKVNYQGERMEDFGMICIKQNDIRQICGRYDVSDNELILSVAMDSNGKIEHEIFGMA